MFVFIKSREDCFLQDFFIHFGPTARIILGSITTLRKLHLYMQQCTYQICAEYCAAYTNKLIYYSSGFIYMYRNAEIAVDLYNLYHSLSSSYIYLYIKLHGYVYIYSNNNICCKVFCKWEETHPYDIITGSEIMLL